MRITFNSEEGEHLHFKEKFDSGKDSLWKSWWVRGAVEDRVALWLFMEVLVEFRPFPWNLHQKFRNFIFDQNSFIAFLGNRNDIGFPGLYVTDMTEPWKEVEKGILIFLEWNTENLGLENICLQYAESLKKNFIKKKILKKHSPRACLLILSSFLPCIIMRNTDNS